VNGIVALLFFSCAPKVIWSAVDPSRTTQVEVLARDGQQWVRGGDAPATKFDAIGKEGVLLSTEGARVIFAAQRAKRWYVVAGEHTYGPYDGVAELTATSDGAHVAFAAQTKDRWQAIIDGAPGPLFTRIEGDTLQVSDQHSLYVGVDGACAFLVVDGRPSVCHRRILSTQLGDVAAALVRDDTGDHLVVGTRDLPQADAIGEWTLSGDRVAYAAKRDGAWRVISDGVESPPCVRIRNIRLAAHLAYECGNAVVVDGEQGDAFEEVRALTLSRQGPSWAYVARDSLGEWVISDEGMSGPFARVEQLVVPPNGGPASFIARADGTTRIVHGDRGLVFPMVIPGSLATTADGAHWAAITGDLKERQLWLTIDGEHKRQLTVAEVMRDEHYGAWMARELQRSPP
jgi:hypothetical protein